MTFSGGCEPTDADEVDEEGWPTNEADHMKQHALDELHQAHDRGKSDNERWVHAAMAQAYASLAVHAEMREERLTPPPYGHAGTG
jgi:hypothetical protein